MKLLGEIMNQTQKKKPIQISSADTETDLSQLLELECYQMILEIKTVLEDESLADADCFNKIEALVCLFEKHGIRCQYRHDFG